MTPRQRETLDFIAAYALANRYSPTYAEIAAFLKVSTPTVYGLLCQLELRGYIKRIPRRTRGIEITKQPPKKRLHIGIYKKKERWIAQIRANGRVNYIGSYDTEREAAEAYDEYVLRKGLDKPLNFGERKSA